MEDKSSYFRNAVYIYFFGGLLTTFYFYMLYTTYTEQKTVLLSVYLCVMAILGMNCYFSYKDSLKNFNEEISQYSYVEHNARVLLASSLAFVLFFNYLGLNNYKLDNGLKLSIEIPVIMSFIFCCLILTLIWMPKNDGIYIRSLRDVKTIFLTLSIASVILSMLNALKIKNFGII